MSDIIGSTYEVVEQIGAGGGGIVYLARHLRLNKQVVLKADKRKITTRPELLRREVDVLKDLSHPYIPQVYDFFEENGIVYTAMDFVDGESLDRPLKEGRRFSQPQVIRWAKQLLQALDYLHSPTHGDPPRGYVHSDIKPANIMRRTNGDICLIDFNISLALGEEHVIGASAGYASPEHYGLDFSFSGNTVTQNDTTDPMHDGTTTLTMLEYKSNDKRRTIIPDVRSDIYSIGATLYHLLSGKRPPKNATDVVPLSGPEISDQVAAIITKAMNPNPDLRYQTAAEMLWDFEHLHENDPRTIRHKRRAQTTAIILAALFLIGGLCSFSGLRRMQQTEAAARVEAEAAEEAERQAKEAEQAAKEAEQAAKEALAAVRNSETAYQDGDIPRAVRCALEALSTETPYAPQAQKALTDALGVYNLSDGFKTYRAVTLPAEPLDAVLSPEGTRLAAISDYTLYVYNIETEEKLLELPAEESALADVVFLDEDRIVYAAPGAIKAYSISQQAELWSGGPATSIVRSADCSRVAAVYKDATEGTVYNTADGTVIKTVPFMGRSQRVAVNDRFVNPHDNLLALNADGTLLAVSFADGTLDVFDLEDPDGDLELLDPDNFTHFEGGFNGQYFAFSATGPEESLFAVIDTVELYQTGGFSLQSPILVQADESGVYVATDNILVKMHPVTGDQTEVAYTVGRITGFHVTGDYALVATKSKGYSVFGPGAQELDRVETDYSGDFLQLAGSSLMAGSRDTPSLRVMKLESHEDAQVFSYDPFYEHDEARLSADGSTVMLFRYDAFRLYDIDGNILAEVEIPNAEQIYDQQYRREGDGSRLEVIYNDGAVRAYSAQDGSVLWEKAEEAPDLSLDEEFFTDKFRITAPLHGTPAAYDRTSGELIRELEENSYLTYVTEVGDYVIIEYISAEGERYGLLLDETCETLAKLPGLCDILADGTLVFDDTRGNLRQSRIYSKQELLTLAESYT